jgi:RNA ligase (TIGR02306 family)
MKLASIEKVKEVIKHPNADALDILSVLGFKCIVKRDQFAVGDLVVFIQPDTVLPDKEWAAFYRAKSNRVKAIRLRQVWSEGIVESLSILPWGLALTDEGSKLGEGSEVSEYLGVTKYDPPLPQDLSAKGVLPFGIPKTDEERFNNIIEIPFGELVDVTLKVDGQSCSIYAHKAEDGSVVTGVVGRTLEYKPECANNYTRYHAKYANAVAMYPGLCFRGESFGSGIQSGGHNPHSKQTPGILFYSVWDIAAHEYAHKGSAFYAYDFLPKLHLPTCPVLERDVVLTPELIAKYADGITEINGQPFEGVVIQHKNGSFKVLNKSYDSKK